MGRLNYEPLGKKRTKRLLEALLAYANYELENGTNIDIQFRWKEDAKEIFKAKGFSGSENGFPELMDLYGGNPLALKVITTMMHEVFKGNVAHFLKQNTLVLGDRSFRTVPKAIALALKSLIADRAISHYP